MDHECARPVPRRAGGFSKAGKLRRITYCAVFVTLIAAGAFIKIPIPVVPFTLQFLFTMLAGLLLGGRSGAASVGVYIVLGLAGLPIFAEGGGIWYLLKPSFGYMIGFCAASYATGKMAENMKAPTMGKLLAANFTGLMIVYTAGMLYYDFICRYIAGAPIGLWTLFLNGFILAVPGDICLCVLAAYLAKRIKPILNKVR